MTRGRKAKYETAAEKQRAYRERHASTKACKTGRVTKLPGSPTNNVTKPVPAIPVASQMDRQPDRLPSMQPSEVQHTTGAIYAHCEAAGLLVRVLELIDGNRVKAEVLQPGTTRLIPGLAYPFRADLLSEVTP